MNRHRPRTRPARRPAVLAALAVGATAALAVAALVAFGSSSKPEPVSRPGGGVARTAVYPVPGPSTTPYVGLEVDEDGPRAARTTTTDPR